jgi:hypothetical protein
LFSGAPDLTLRFRLPRAHSVSCGTFRQFLFAGHTAISQLQPLGAQIVGRDCRE